MYGNKTMTSPSAEKELTFTCHFVRSSRLTNHIAPHTPIANHQTARIDLLLDYLQSFVVRSQRRSSQSGSQIPASFKNKSILLSQMLTIFTPLARYKIQFMISIPISPLASFHRCFHSIPPNFLSVNQPPHRHRLPVVVFVV
jgi:hypothetical protein